MLTASIVFYRNKFDIVAKAIDSLIGCNYLKEIYIIDNSPTDNLRVVSDLDNRIKYIHNIENTGFGKAHNIALKKANKIKGVKYHLVLNPDVYFNSDILLDLVNYMELNIGTGLISPKVYYPNEDVQYTCRLLPSPFDLFIRRMSLHFGLFKKKVEESEMRWTGYDKIMNVPFLLGCFYLLRLSTINEVGLFDERYFMYMEDLDLSRRIHRKFKTCFYPDVSVYHTYNKESSKSLKLLFTHLKSSIEYFNHWGWIYDKERRNINETAKKNANKFVNSPDIGL